MDPGSSSFVLFSLAATPDAEYCFIISVNNGQIVAGNKEANTTVGHAPDSPEDSRCVSVYVRVLGINPGWIQRLQKVFECLRRTIMFEFHCINF